MNHALAPGIKPGWGGGGTDYAHLIINCPPFPWIFIPSYGPELSLVAECLNHALAPGIGW